MPQRTVFPVLPNVIEQQYLFTLQSLFGELDRRGPTPFKVFRDWLKERNLYNKEEAEDLLALLGCVAKPDVALGDFPRKFIAANGPEQQQRALYVWLNNWNPILTKYVFEALDVDAGGRLHSTHELYRLITSYVYPGTYVTLPNFQSWIRWMGVTGFIKIIGIRWGLSDSGKREMQTIRNFDVDEFLEDEADAAAQPAPVAVAVAAPVDAPAPRQPAMPSAPAAPPAASPPRPVAPTPPPSASPTAAATGDEEELPDMPPEAGPPPEWTPPADEPPARSPAAAPAEPMVVRLPAPAPAPPPPPPPSAPLVAATSPNVAVEQVAGRPFVAPQTAEDLADNAGRLRAWHAAWPAPRIDTVTAYGLDPKSYAERKEPFVLRVLFLGRLATGGFTTPEHHGAIAKLLGTPLFDLLATTARPIEDVLSAAGWFAAEPAIRALLPSVTFDLLALRAFVRGRGVVANLEALEAEPLVRLLANDAYRDPRTPAPFWAAREMAALGLWTGLGLADLSAVPDDAARHNGFRLGFLGSPYAPDLDALVAASRALSGWFPAAHGGDAALRVVHQAYRCGYGCPYTRTCDLACREKPARPPRPA